MALTMEGKGNRFVKISPSFTFSCPSCGRQVTADLQDLGQKVACPGCNQIITVPGGLATTQRRQRLGEPPIKWTHNPESPSRPTLGGRLSRPAANQEPRASSAGKTEMKNSGAMTLVVLALLVALLGGGYLYYRLTNPVRQLERIISLHSDRSTYHSYTYNIEKTPSIITPYVGYIWYRDSSWGKYKATFAYQDGKWVPKSVETPSGSESYPMDWHKACGTF
jgi:DNA-directed RNA polymerase subunit RPC12/RpoP